MKVHYLWKQFTKFKAIPNYYRRCQLVVVFFPAADKFKFGLANRLRPNGFPFDSGAGAVSFWASFTEGVVASFTLRA